MSKSVTFSGEHLELIGDAVALLLSEAHKPYAPWDAEKINRLRWILSAVDGRFRPFLLPRRCDCARSDCRACAEAAELAEVSAREYSRRWRRRGAACASVPG